jgi:hypothetical protein
VSAVRLAEGDVDDDEVLYELRSAGDHGAVGAHDHRAAVEHELVLAAHHVHVRDRRTGAPRSLPQHRRTLRDLALVEGGRIDVDDHLCPCVALRDERAGLGPRVLADAHPDDAFVGVQQPVTASLAEVTLLVEDPVVRETLLVIDRRDSAPVADRGGIEQAVVICIHETDDGDEISRDGGDLVERGEVRPHERPLQDEVLGRVAGHRELGEGDDLGPCSSSLFDGRDDARAVAVDVADGEVQLRERDLRHRPSVAGPHAAPRSVTWRKRRRARLRAWNDSRITCCAWSRRGASASSGSGSPTCWAS